MPKTMVEIHLLRWRNNDDTKTGFIAAFNSEDDANALKKDLEDHAGSTDRSFFVDSVPCR